MGCARADLGEPQHGIRAEEHALRQVAERVREDLYEAVVGGHILAGIPGGLAELACHSRHVPAFGFTPPAQSLTSHIGQHAHPRELPGRWTAPVRSRSLLRFHYAMP